MPRIYRKKTARNTVFSGEILKNVGLPRGEHAYIYIYIYIYIFIYIYVYIHTRICIGSLVYGVLTFGG